MKLVPRLIEEWPLPKKNKKTFSLTDLESITEARRFSVDFIDYSLRTTTNVDLTCERVASRNIFGLTQHNVRGA